LSDPTTYAKQKQASIARLAAADKTGKVHREAKPSERRQLAF